MTRLRILQCGQFGRRQGYATYGNVDTKLRNGLVRGGHNVVAVGERDTAHDLAPLGFKARGVARMRRQLVKIAAHYEPHLLLFGHTDLLDDATFDALRSVAPRARTACYFVDPFTTRERTLLRFAARARHMDAVFATTAEPSLMRPYVAGAGSVHFMPNPVDASIETARNDNVARESLRWDGIFLGTDIMTRKAQLDALEQALPADYRFLRGGTQIPGGRVRSTLAFKTMAAAGACPQLALDDSRTEFMPRLYTSDRIAQTLGQGIVALTPASARLEEVYEEGVVPYGSRTELAERMTALQRDDSERRRRAAIGRRISHERTNATRVASYMIETTFGAPLSESYGWPTEALA